MSDSSRTTMPTRTRNQQLADLAAGDQGLTRRQPPLQGDWAVADHA